MSTQPPSAPSDGSAGAAGASKEQPARPKFRAHGKRQLDTAAGQQAPRSTIREYVTEDDWRARRRPEGVQEIVDRLIGKIGGGTAAPAVRLATSWVDVVGPEFARRSLPASCDAGRLVVLVADGATASKMRFVTSQILQNTAKIVGEGTVASISFRVTPKLGR